MAQINTRIILRNDSSFNWTVHEDVVLLKGEIGIEFLSDDSCKIKIGDGVKSWKELDYFGEQHYFIGDNKSIVVNDEVISLKGFAEAAEGAQPRKNADGEIEWIVPSGDSIEGLQQTIINIQEDITNLENIVYPDGEEGQTLLEKVTTLETIVSGTGEGSVDEKINKAINDFANSISDDGSINTLKELIDYVEDHGNEVQKIIEDISDLEELVGLTSVQSQIETALNDYNAVKNISLKGTMLEKIDGVVTIPVGAGIISSEEIIINEDGSLNVETININKIVQNAGDFIILNGGIASGDFS